MRSRLGASIRLAAFAVFAAAWPFAALAAQRHPTPEPQAPSDQTAVRAELAAVLLQSKKYDDAVREYRALLTRDPSNSDYRLGLARALAWGNHPRDAERELKTLQSQHAQAATVDTLLRKVREAIEPTSSEAAAWVAERRDYAPYRLAYARALANERYDWIAAAEYDTLIAGTGGSGQLPDVLILRREQANALLDAGDRSAGAASLRKALLLSPRDTALRHELAVALAGGPWMSEALSHYDTLLARAPSAPLFVERAELRLTMGDSVGAERDFQASIDLAPTADAYLVLADIARERGDFNRARAMYRGALSQLALWHRDGEAVTEALARIDREERPVAAFVPAVGSDRGWRLGTDGAADNLGVYYAATTMRGSVALSDVSSAGITVLQQFIGEHSAVRSASFGAYGAEGSVSGGSAYGALLTKFGLTAGALAAPGSGALAIGDATAAVWLDAWELALDGSTGPAYPSLLTTTALRPLDSDVNDVLTEQDIAATLGGPIGTADVAATAQLARLSDGNRRETWQGYLRVPLAPSVNAIAATDHVSFAQRSVLYWDPMNYFSQSVGVELTDGGRQGLAWSVSALPGIAWSRQLPPPTIFDGQVIDRPDSVIDRTALQLGTSGDVGWRTPRWEATAGATYSIGRVGDYRRFGLSLGIRVIQ